MADFAIICQPTAGRQYDEVLEARERAMKALAEAGYQVKDTFMIEARYTEELLEKMGVVDKAMLMLSKMLEIMSTCKRAYFSAGWKTDKLCQLLHDVAERMGMETVEE